MYRKDGILRSTVGVNPNDGFLVQGFRSGPADGYVRSLVGVNANDGFLFRQRYDRADAAAAPPLFPTQYAGLRTFYGAAVRELCLVATADAPAGMGAVWRILKGATTYAVYLVETTDPNASSVRLRTSAGTKAVRLKT